MYTSDIDRRLYAAGIRYLAASAAVAVAGAVYELFSHGVYSYYMIYVFALPLAGGAVPCLLAAAGRKRRGRCEESTVSSKLQLASIVTLTTGSIMKGILEIYGTTNRLAVLYAAAGIALAAAALAAFACESARRTGADVTEEL